EAKAALPILPAVGRVGQSLELSRHKCRVICTKRSRARGAYCTAIAAVRARTVHTHCNILALLSSCLSVCLSAMGYERKIASLFSLTLSLDREPSPPHQKPMHSRVSRRPRSSGAPTASSSANYPDAAQCMTALVCIPKMQQYSYKKKKKRAPCVS
ncbi:unnamed protein product, partial [Ectocarpus sp. 8 AP-2014]